MNALISVSDKTGILEFAQALHALGINCCPPAAPPNCWPTRLAGDEVADHTGFPECWTAVKTRTTIHGGLLARRDVPEHMAAPDHGIATIDLLVVNLYPFESPWPSWLHAEDAIENIDIGGPAMVRSRRQKTGVTWRVDRRVAVPASAGRVERWRVDRRDQVRLVGGGVQPHQPV
jgi:phosphoribosylaminoimidazolecarboxamide formyltransferase/IMP cyclohydrolase